MGLFLSTLKGGFWGAWLSGRVFDATGNYNGVWYIGIVLALAAALIPSPCGATSGLHGERPAPAGE